MYKVVDLFAGAGGLSLGFMQTKKYDIKVAYENNPNMKATYKKNHASVDVRGDVCSANYDEIREKYGTKELGADLLTAIGQMTGSKELIRMSRNMEVNNMCTALEKLKEYAGEAVY